MSEYCDRCDRFFPHDRALQQHLSMSSRHNECQYCDLDFEDREDLEDHESEQHAPCSDCGDRFQDENQLFQHQLVHKPRSIECWGCYKKFKNLSHVFLHLETGTCDFVVTADDIKQRAIKLRGPWRNDLDSDYVIRCPQCDRVYALVSGFLQHIESQSCLEGYFSGPRSAWGLLRQLRQCLGFHPLMVHGVSV